jgi:hypothetical protein
MLQSDMHAQTYSVSGAPESCMCHHLITLQALHEHRQDVRQQAQGGIWVQLQEPAAAADRDVPAGLCSVVKAAQQSLAQLGCGAIAQ